jgi:hypothetical protein
MGNNPNNNPEKKPEGSLPKWLKNALDDKRHFAHDEMVLMRDLTFEHCQEAMELWEIPGYFWDQVQRGGFTAEDCAVPTHEDDESWTHKPGAWDKIINRMPWSMIGGRASLMQIVYNFRGLRYFRQVQERAGKLSVAQKAYVHTVCATLLKYGIENDLTRRLKMFVDSQHSGNAELMNIGRSLWYREPDGTLTGGVQYMHGSNFGWKWPWAAKLAVDACWRRMRVLKVGEKIVQMREEEYALRQAEKNAKKKLTFKEKVESGDIVVVTRD